MSKVAPARNASRSVIPPADTAAELLPKKVVYGWLALFLVLGLIMRMVVLDRMDLHIDEWTQLSTIQTASFRTLWSDCIRLTAHPPLSFAIEKVMYGFTPAISWLRGISAVAGTIVIFLTFRFFSMLCGRRVGLLSAALASFSYILVWYSRELRDYIFFYMFVLLALDAFVRVLRFRGEGVPWKDLSLFVVSNILAAYTHCNVILTWPLYGAIYLASLWRNRQVRWARLVWFLAAAVLILAASIPMLLQFNASRQALHGTLESYRPDFAKWLTLMAPQGLGGGWRFLVWGCLLAAGIAGLRSQAADVRNTLLLWILIPWVGFVYGLGMPGKFVIFSSRYMIFTEIAFLGLMSIGLDQLAVWFSRRAKVAPLKAAAILLAGLALVLARPYSLYYRLRATQDLRSDIVAALESIQPAAVMVDNYYHIINNIGQYAPKDIRLTHPPIFGNSEEFMGNDVPGFLQRECQRDPLMAFFESGGRAYAPSRVSWDWVDKDFRHTINFVNTNAIELAKLDLNLFSFLTIDSFYKQRLHFNRVEDLPRSCARNPAPQSVVFGPDWMPVTLAGLDGRWRHWRVTPDRGTLYAWNGASSNVTVRLSLRAHGGMPKQRMDVSVNGGGPIGRFTLENGPARGVFYRERRQFEDYIPFGKVPLSFGMLALPIALDPPFVPVFTDRFQLAPGLTPVTVTALRQEGVLIDTIGIEL